MTESLAERLTREHRELDELFGRFLAAVSRGQTGDAAAAIEAFDRELRVHTELEEERLYPPLPSPQKLAAPVEEEEEARRFRELRLEHVQVRELSGMIRRLLTEEKNLDAARALQGNLARRWDAHTTREETEAFGSGA